MRSDVAPSLVHDGLAIYDTGGGEPVLLMPSPHGFVLGPAVAGPLHEVLIGVGCRVVTFDPPGAFASSRPPALTLEEMTRSAVESLDAVGAGGPVPVVAHSHATLCSMGLALQHADRVDRLLLIGAVAGGAAVSRADRGLPFSLSPLDLRFWRIASLGTRLALRGNLGAHRRLLDLVQQLSYLDQTAAPRVPVRPGDARKPAPVRDRWQRYVRRVDLRARLPDLHHPALVCVGRNDPQTPVAANAAVAAALPNAELVIFEHSGHYPFVEERERFTEVAAEFLHADTSG